MDLMNVLTGLGLPAAYGKFDTPQKPPFAVYLGAGQERIFGDNTIYSKVNDYTVEYYFTKKDAAKEDALENALLNSGFIYEKSEDDYIEDDNIFVIYYTVGQKPGTASAASE